MTKQISQEQLITTQYRVAMLCNEATNIDKAARAFLSLLGTAFGWQTGSLWIIDPAMNALQHVYTWSINAAFTELEKANKATLFKLKEGITGHIWDIKTPYWSADLNKDPFCTQKQICTPLNLKNALGFPLLIYNNILGVAVFFSDDIPKPEDRLLDMLSSVGNQFGILIHRIQEETEQNFIREELYLKINELEEQLFYLQQANKAKSTFLANVSHEIRTPLNSIIGYSELMYKGKVGALAPEHKEYLGEIAKNSRYLLRLLNDILDLTKIESGEMHCYPEPTDLKTLINDVYTTMALSIADKNIHFNQYIDPLLSREIIIDPDKLKQILFNFLSNAIKFTPSDGNISIRVLQAPNEDNYFRLEVSDTGIGISKKDLSKLFAMFGQLDINYSRPFHGVGLGLALTRYVAELMGGRVGVESEPGQGSTFFAILPLIFVKETESKNSPRR